MQPTFNERLIAYLTLISGLSISAVAIYYSVAGLVAIFAAAVVPVIIMGVTLEISKLVATVWLKQNWNIAPKTIKAYLIVAIGVLMFITSLGIFGFLSKAHSDQGLVSGDVLAKIAIYDEKIKIAKENIDANRKALKQMDEAVDQTMGRSTTVQGAERSVQIRRSQQRERVRLAQDIEAEQKKISQLMEERAPIAAAVREVDAKVGPIKYIAAFVYGETDNSILEKSVTWIIIIIVLVFDPLALVLLLASQHSFQNFRERKQIKSIPVKETAEGDSPEKESDVVSLATVTNLTVEPSQKEFDIKDHPYLFKKPTSYHPPGVEPVGPQVYRAEVSQPVSTSTVDNQRIENLLKALETNVEKLYVQNEEQSESNLWSSTTGTKIINEIDYNNISQEKLEEKINYYAHLLREKKISATEIPKEILLQVKARV